MILQSTRYRRTFWLQRRTRSSRSLILIHRVSDQHAHNTPLGLAPRSIELIIIDHKSENVVMGRIAGRYAASRLQHWQHRRMATPAALAKMLASRVWSKSLVACLIANLAIVTGSLFARCPRRGEGWFFEFVASNLCLLSLTERP